MGDRTYAVDANNFLVRRRRRSDGIRLRAVWRRGRHHRPRRQPEHHGHAALDCGTASLTPQQQRIDAAVVIDVTAIVVTSGCYYKLMVLVSNDPAFGATNVMLAGALQLAIAGTGDVPNNFTPPAVPAIGGNRYEILFSNEQNNVKYEYVKLYVVLGGSNASITFKAFMAVLPAMQ